jgi:hypothetical protein
MNTPASARSVARLLADVFQAEGLEYAIGGAVALTYHAAPRDTIDVDVTVFFDVPDLPRIVDVLHRAGCSVDEEDARRRLGREECIRASCHGIRVDLFVPDIDLYASACNRRMTVLLEGRPVRIWSAEDLILFKLLFFRPKDRLDIERVVLFQAERLDQAYVRQWLIRMVGEEDERTRFWDGVVPASGRASRQG